MVVNNNWTDEETTLDIGKFLQSYNMETVFPLTYSPSIIGAIKNDVTFKDIKLAKCFEMNCAWT